MAYASKNPKFSSLKFATGSSLSLYEEGTISLSFTGAVSTSQTWNYVRVGKMMLVTWADNVALTATGTAFFTATIGTAALRPANNAAAIVIGINNNGTHQTTGWLSIGTDGVINIYKDITGAAWTSGTGCGWDRGQISYILP